LNIAFRQAGDNIRRMRHDEVTDESIARLVDEFYTKIRVDPELGPVFARAIPGDWGPHLATMRDFWSSVMLTSGRYKGNPVIAHRRVEGIEMPMFERWLALFGETCGELFEDDIAAVFRAKATRIAESLKLAVFYRPDRPWPPPAQ
jgi:hemoglobin